MDWGPVVDREHELARLAALADGVMRGRGGTLVIEGQPGLGKSTVLSEAIRRPGRRGWPRTARFCCGELEQDLLWAAIRGLLAQTTAGTGAIAERRALFAGEAAPARGALTGVGGGQSPAHRVLDTTVHALFAVIARLAEISPLLLVLDDAHWCDAPSLQALAYLQRRVHALPVGLVLAMRPALASRKPALLERLQTGPDAEVCRLQNLRAAAVAMLVRSQAFPDADAGFCDACRRLTAGNPFYLRELVAELRRRGIDPRRPSDGLADVVPPAVLNSLLVRLDRLPATGAASLARAAAVLGDGAGLRQAANLAGIDARSATAAFDALSAAELLAGGEPLRFVHPLVRTALYSSIPPAQRAEHHARAAELLRAGHAPTPIVALHLLHAPRAASETTVEVLRGAAARARAQGAAHAAVGYLRRALDEPPPPEDRADVLVELAHAETAVGDHRAPGRLAEALELIEDDRRRAAILLDLGWAQHHAGRFRAAAGAFEQGLTVARALSDADLEADLEAGYLMAAMFDARRVGDALRRIDVIETRSAGIEASADRVLQAQVVVRRALAGAPHRQTIELAQRIWADGPAGRRGRRLAGSVAGHRCVELVRRLPGGGAGHRAGS